MNENINLSEILKDCPKGTKLYSPILGEVEFQEVKETHTPIIVRSYLQDCGSSKVVQIKESFTSDGKLYIGYKGDECLLFPSKEQRDWSKWKCTKPKFDPKTLQPFDKILVRWKKYNSWVIDYFGFFNEDNNASSTAGVQWPYAVPYNDDTKHLLGTTDEAPEYYRYWED